MIKHIYLKYEKIDGRLFRELLILNVQVFSYKIILFKVELEKYIKHFIYRIKFLL